MLSARPRALSSDTRDVDVDCHRVVIAGRNKARRASGRRRRDRMIMVGEADRELRSRRYGGFGGACDCGSLLRVVFLATHVSRSPWNDTNR